MEANQKMNVSMLEDELHAALRGAVASEVFAGQPPATVKPGTTEFVVVDVVSVRDWTFGRQMGKATVNIALYARRGLRGEKDSAAINRMENALNSALESLDSAHYSATELYRAQDCDQTIGFHYALVAVEIMVY